MREAGNLTMSAKEVNRLEIIGRVIERRLTQRQAAERLGLSVRQIERLCRAYRNEGAAGLVSRKRGRPSNRKLSIAVRRACVGFGARSLFRFRSHAGVREADGAAWL